MSALILCHVHHAVHIGDPIRKRGFSSRSSCRAFSLLAGTSKSQGRPSSGSMHVMSKANPGARYWDGMVESIRVTRGGE